MLLLKPPNAALCLKAKRISSRISRGSYFQHGKKSLAMMRFCLMQISDGLLSLHFSIAMARLFLMSSSRHTKLDLYYFYF